MITHPIRFWIETVDQSSEESWDGVPEHNRPPGWENDTRVTAHLCFGDDGEGDAWRYTRGGFATHDEAKTWALLALLEAITSPPSVSMERVRTVVGELAE